MRISTKFLLSLAMAITFIATFIITSGACSYGYGEDIIPEHIIKD